MPDNTGVVLSPYLVQPHPTHWPESERFHPDRFLPVNSDPRNRFANLPASLAREPA